MIIVLLLVVVYLRILREADKYNPSIILIEGVSREGLGLAIMNRLIRASGYNYKVVDKD